MLLIFWTTLVALGLARFVRLVVKDTWPPILWLRIKLFMKFPPAGLTLDTDEEIAQVTTNQDGYTFFRGHEVVRRGNYYEVFKGHWFGELFDCHHCFGGWAAIAAAFFWYFAGGNVVAGAMTVAAISPAVAILAAWMGFWFVVSAFSGRI